MTSETPPKPFSEVTESQACKADILYHAEKRLNQINIHNKKQRRKKKIPENSRIPEKLERM